MKFLGRIVVVDTLEWHSGTDILAAWQNGWPACSCQLQTDIIHSHFHFHFQFHQNQLGQPPPYRKQYDMDQHSTLIIIYLLEVWDSNKSSTATQNHARPK